MGRKKIIIEPIREDRNRQVTFMKRKQGLLKKAMELSILCKCEVSVLIFSEQGKMFEYASNDMDKMVKRREQHSKDSESKTNHDVSSLPPIQLSTSHWRLTTPVRMPTVPGLAGEDERPGDQRAEGQGGDAGHGDGGVTAQRRPELGAQKSLPTSRPANVVLTPFCAVAGAGKCGGGPGLGRRVGFARPRGEEAQGLPRSAHPVAARSEEFAGQLRRGQRIEGIRGIWGCGGRCVRRRAALHRRPALRRRAGLALAPAQRQGRAELHAVVWGGHADATLEPDAAGATVAGWDPARYGRHGQHQRAAEHLRLVRL